MFELQRYQTADGRQPFGEWLNGLRDRVAQARVPLRLRQVEAGNLGDAQSIGRAKAYWADWRTRTNARSHKEG